MTGKTGEFESRLFLVKLLYQIGTFVLGILKIRQSKVNKRYAVSPKNFWATFYKKSQRKAFYKKLQKKASKQKEINKTNLI